MTYKPLLRFNVNCCIFRARNDYVFGKDIFECYTIIYLLKNIFAKIVFKIFENEIKSAAFF